MGSTRRRTVKAQAARVSRMATACGHRRVRRVNTSRIEAVGQRERPGSARPRPAPRGAARRGFHVKHRASLGLVPSRRPADPRPTRRVHTSRRAAPSSSPTFAPHGRIRRSSGPAHARTRTQPAAMQQSAHPSRCTCAPRSSDSVTRGAAVPTDSHRDRISASQPSRQGPRSCRANSTVSRETSLPPMRRTTPTTPPPAAGRETA